MSDLSSQPSTPPAAPQQATDKPVPESKPEPLGDFDNSINSHLGLPFYFRHTPTRPLARTAFWLGFLSTAVLMFYDLIHMPYPKDTHLYALRMALFENSRVFDSYAHGGEAMFSQLFVVAIVLSGIIAPLFATFSFSSERVLGTMEFLRLSPMSTLSIVMGKMFAPSYTLHLFSSALLLCGVTVGLLVGLPFGSICLMVLIVILSSALAHALGAFLAAYTMAFRGFASVLGLVLLGFAVSGLPVSAVRQQGVAHLSLLSPWGAMAELFWERDRNAHWPPEFFGSQSAVVPFVICAYLVLCTLLVWAATRKLDRPENQALPMKGWLVLWIAVLVTGFGAVNNFPAPAQGQTPEGWIVAWLTILFGSLGCCSLALMDHPHSRETMLTDECERLSSHPQGQRPFRLGHLVFVTILVAMSAGLLTALFYYFEPSTRQIALSTSLSLAVLPVILTVCFALALEAGAVGFKSASARTALSAAAISIILAAGIAPIVHVVSSYTRWWSTIYSAQTYYSVLSSPPGKNKVQAMNYWEKEMLRIRNDPDESIYVEQVKSVADAKSRLAEYEHRPIDLFLRYHRGAALSYPAILAGLFVLLLIQRRRFYLTVYREAAAAVGVVPIPAAASPPVAELAQAV